MNQSDGFYRSKPTAGLPPLARRTGPLVDPAALRAAIAQLIEQGKGSLARLEPRVEVLVRACREAALGVPGVGEVTLRHPLTPKAEQMIRYVVYAFEQTPDLKRPVQVTIFRFYDAARAMREAGPLVAEGLFDAQLLEELKIKLYSLSRSHADFQDDKLLSQLFPGPQVVRSGAAERPISEVDRLRQKMARETYLLHVETFERSMAGPVAVIEQVIALLERRGGAWVDVFSPAARMARLAAMRLVLDKPAQAQLRAVLEAHQAFTARLNEARRAAHEDFGPLKASAASFHQAMVTCRQHPLLKDCLHSDAPDMDPSPGFTPN